MSEGQVVIPKVWRSEIGSLMIFFVSSIACIFISWRYPATVVRGRLFTIGDTTFFLSFPVFWILPFVILCWTMLKIYNVRYVVDSRGIEACEGIFAVNQRITRIRYEDIRSIETEQSITERLLDIGDLEMGTAAQADVEVTFHGIAAPHEVLGMVQRERDRRQKLSGQAGQFSL